MPHCQSILIPPSLLSEAAPLRGRGEKKKRKMEKIKLLFLIVPPGTKNKTKHIQLLRKRKYGKEVCPVVPDTDTTWIFSGCWRTHTQKHTPLLARAGEERKIPFRVRKLNRSPQLSQACAACPRWFASAAKGLVLKAWFSLSRAIQNHLSHTDRRWKYISSKLLDWGWVYQTNYTEMLWEVGGNVITYDRDDQNCLHSKSGNW